MNIFELSFYASPIGGLLGGLTATKGMAGISSILAGGLGVAVGVGFYFGIIGAGWLIAKMTGVARPKNRKDFNKAGTIMLIFVLLPMLALPILSAWAAHLLAVALFK